jgi:hypothetical protein
MLWILGRLDQSRPWSDGRKRLIRCAVECAEEAAPYEGNSEAGRMAALCRQTVYLWTRGEATRDDVIEAREAAAVYMYSVDIAVAYAASAASAAANVADASATAAVAAYAAYAAFDAAERDRVLARCADIVRSHYPDPPAIKGGDR